MILKKPSFLEKLTLTEERLHETIAQSPQPGMEDGAVYSVLRLALTAMP